MMKHKMNSEMFEAIENEVKKHSVWEDVEDMVSDIYWALVAQGFEDIVVVNGKALSFSIDGYCVGCETIWFRRNNKQGYWKIVR